MRKYSKGAPLFRRPFEIKNHLNLIISVIAYETDTIDSKGTPTCRIIVELKAKSW